MTEHLQPRPVTRSEARLLHPSTPTTHPAVPTLGPATRASRAGRPRRARRRWPSRGAVEPVTLLSAHRPAQPSLGLAPPAA